MEIGCCGGLQERSMLAELGFDFIEPPVGELAPMEGEERLQQKLKEVPSSLPIYAFNCFIPGDLKLVGPDRDLDKLSDYVQRVFKRVHSLGGKVIVLGSGGARHVPDGYDQQQAEGEIVEFLQMIADPAKKYGIIIAIEHLRAAESNIINTVKKGLELARKADRPENIRVLLDNFHLEEEEEPYEVIREVGDMLAHIHLADTGRYYPGSGDYDYDKLLSLLKETGYSGKMSIECSWKDKQEEAKKALSFLRQKCREYGI